MLLLCGFFGIINFKNDSVRATTYYVGGSGNYTTIQKAIDAASNGDTVYVNAGTYQENVYINKSISLIGASSSNTTIDGMDVKDVIWVSADWVNISGFTIKNGGKNSNDAGIELYRAKNCSIISNNVSSNGYYGIYSFGMKPQEFVNRIENNIISFNNYSGVYLIASAKNYVINNIIYDNNKLNSNTDGGVKIYLFSDKNEITGNTIYNNKYSGIICYSSHNNVINYNKIDNTPRGIYFPTSGVDNVIYLNDFTLNTNHNSGSVSSSIWNSTEKISYYYNNVNFSSYLGNYWDDYAGIDNNGDGIGDTSYSVGSTKDYYPLMEPIDKYTLIPPSIEVDMDAMNSKSKNVTVKIVAHNATLNVSLSGGLNGFINFTTLEIVTIASGLFKGKGFFKSNWSATIEGLPYQGTWRGMLFQKPGVRKINLKGTLFGGLQGITDGYFIESTNGSGVYDVFNSTSTINHLGTDVVYSEFTLNGTVDYQKSQNSTSEIYILQSLFKGNATGYYNRSLSVVLTHVRINNKTHQYYGFGFSIISYVSTLGAGKGWTYDSTVSPNVVSMTGFFTKPLLGIVFGKLNETGIIKKLSLTIIRLEMGLPPKVILDMNVWGPYRLYPGQKANYFIEYSNIGLKGVINTEIIMTLPQNTTYLSSTGNGTYDNLTKEITWRQNISAKSKTLFSAKIKVDWGLARGTKLYCNGSIRDYIKNVTLVSDSYKSSVLCAKDPNVKYGPEGFVIAGEQLNYKIEFENEGAGTAYGVYFTDTLSEYLDEYTLKITSVYSKKDDSLIGAPGIYDHWTRTITWFAGEVGPGEGGYANLSIKVRADAIPGTEIINYGVVHFPSVPEVTRTNGIVSIVVLNKNPTAIAGKNLVVKTLEQVIFDGSGSSDLDGLIVNYTWDFGDAEFGYGKVTTHSYMDDGNYKVKLIVMDNWDGTDVHEIDIQVLNRVPEAILDVDLTEVNTHEVVSFNAEDSLDLDGEVLEYYLDFGDGSNSGWIQTPTASHTYSDGTNLYTVKLSVKDDDGAVNENTAEVKITVNNMEPLATLSADKIEAFTYEYILFNGGLSTDSDGSISTYFFDFGDGTNSDWVSTSSDSHQYTDGTKEYTVQLIVRDDDGEISVADITIKIKNRAPEAVAGYDLVADTNQDVNFNGQLSSDKDGKIKSYSWTFGDGSSGSGRKTTHDYEDNGQYSVTLTVEDDDGAIAKDTCTVTVNNVKPVANFIVEPTTGDVNTLFEFSSTSYDTDGSIAKFSWDFGDGSTSAEANPTYQYKTSGTYTVLLTVQDDDDLTSNAFKKEITLFNLPPIAIAESSVTSGKVGEKITFDASKSYDLDGKIIEYIWDFGDGNQAIGQSVQYSFDKEGTYTVMLAVIDDLDNIASINLDLKIIEVFIDSDGDGISDNKDPDDDNDGMPDIWEQRYGLKLTDPADAQMDPDNDFLTNFNEYLHSTDPANPDTDGEGILDGVEINNYLTSATNPDTDNDGYDDKIDAYPLDPSRHEKESVPTGSNIHIFIILIVVLLIIILALTPIIIRKRRLDLIWKSYIPDKTLRAVGHAVVTDSDGQNLKHSWDIIKEKLETSHMNGEISETNYKYIKEKVLHLEEGQ